MKKVIFLSMLVMMMHGCLNHELSVEESYLIKKEDLLKYPNKSEVLFLKILSSYQLDRKQVIGNSELSADAYLCYVHNTSDTIWVFELINDKTSKAPPNYIHEHNSSVIALQEDVILNDSSWLLNIGINPDHAKEHPALIVKRLHVED